MSDLNLQSPLELGALTLPNRVIMAPMTRARTRQPGDIPTPLMAQYYAQRASAGLIISEATQISPQGKGYSFTPGLHSPEQIQGWRLVTDAVHGAQGRIFAQLWHVGRMSHASLHEDGLPVAPSAVAPGAQVWIVGEDGTGRMLDCPVPRALSEDEIPGVIEDYRKAARAAVAAGFDGVEIHGANGYLIDQFLRRNSNQRRDAYGGAIEHRIRFAREVAAAVADEIGSERVGIRLSPYITQRGMNDPEIIDAILLLACELQTIGITYIHLAEADWDDAPIVPDAFRPALRNSFKGRIIVAGNYDQVRAEKILSQGHADCVAFGRKFIANPDLPERFEKGLPLNEDIQGDALFGGDARGYTDYPRFQAA